MKINCKSLSAFTGRKVTTSYSGFLVHYEKDIPILVRPDGTISLPETRPLSYDEGKLLFAFLAELQRALCNGGTLEMTWLSRAK